MNRFPKTLREAFNPDEPQPTHKTGTIDSIKKKLPPLEYSQLINGLYQGAAAPIGSEISKKFDALVLMAKEHQPDSKKFSNVEVLHAGINDGVLIPADIQKAYSAAQWVVQRVKSGKNVLVTCMQGLNRSGLVSAMALIMMGYSPSDAINVIRSTRGPEALNNKHFLKILKGMKKVTTSESLIREAIRLMLEEVDLMKYSTARDYTKAELEIEVGEYFENSTTRSTIPGLFNSPDDARVKIKEAPFRHLSQSELDSLQNSDVSEIIHGGGMQSARDLAEKYGKDIDSIIEAFEASEAVPPPIIIEDRNGSLYLLGGNTRLMTAIAMGLNPLVKVIEFEGQFRLDT